MTRIEPGCFTEPVESGQMNKIFGALAPLPPMEVLLYILYKILCYCAHWTMRVIRPQEHNKRSIPQRYINMTCSWLGEMNPGVGRFSADPGGRCDVLLHRVINCSVWGVNWLLTWFIKSDCLGYSELSRQMQRCSSPHTDSINPISHSDKHDVCLWISTDAFL